MIMDKKKETAASSAPVPATVTPGPTTRSRSYLSRETFLGLVVAGSFIALVGGVVAMKTFLMPPQAPQSRDVVQAPPAQPPEPAAHQFAPIEIPANRQPTYAEAGPLGTLAGGETNTSPSNPPPAKSVVGAPSVPDVHLSAPEPVFTLNADKTKPMTDIRTVSAEAPAVVVPPPSDVAPLVAPPVIDPPADSPKTEPIPVIAPPEEPARIRLTGTDPFQPAVKEPEVKLPDHGALSNNSVKRVSNDSTVRTTDGSEKTPPMPDAPPTVPPLEAPIVPTQTKQKPAPDAPVVQPADPLKIDLDKIDDANRKVNDLSDAPKKKNSSIKIDLDPAPTISPPANVDPLADSQKKADSPAVIAPPADSPPMNAPNLKITLPKKVDAPVEPKASRDIPPASLDIAPSNADKKVDAPVEPKKSRDAASASLDNTPKSADKNGSDFDEDLHSMGKNESYRAISKQYYNSDAYSIALERYNRDRPGQSDYVRIPPIWVLEKNYASDITGGTARPVNYAAPPVVAAPRNDPVYTVSENGEMLADIARTQLGSENAWKRIWDLNPQLNPAKTIAGGTRLHMPGQ